MSAHTTNRAAWIDRWPVVLVLCVACAAVWRHDYVWPPDAILYTEGVKGQDCGQMIWNLWHTAEAVTHGRNPYQAPDIFSPVGAPLAQHTIAAGFVPVTLAVKLLSGNAPLYPVYAFRVITLLCCALLLFFSYQFLRALGLARAASGLAAAGYAFSDFYTWHTVHLNHLAGWFIPLTAWLLVRCWQQPTPRRAVLAATSAAVAVYFTELAAYLWIAAALYGVGLCLWPAGRGELWDKARRVGFAPLLGALGLIGLLVAPFVWQMAGLAVRKPAPAESLLFSANLAALFVPHIPQSPLYAWLFSTVEARVTASMGEPGAFLGLPVLALALLGLPALRNHFVKLAAWVGLVFLVLSLGPALQIFETNTGWPLPYALLARVPPFDLARTPVRLVALASFFVMILAAFGAAWLLSKRGAWVLGLLLAAWILAEAYVPVPPQKFAPPDLSKLQAGPVLNLPLYRTDGYAALLQTQHHQPIATGYLARNTEATWAHYLKLQQLLQRSGTGFCVGVKDLGYRNIIVAPETTWVGEVPDLAGLELKNCDVNVVDLRAFPAADERPLSFAPLPLGRAINAPDVAPFLWYGWSDPEGDFRWTNGNAATLAFALEEVKTLTLRLEMGAFRTQRVEVSVNGTALQTLELTGDMQIYSIVLPARLLQRENILRLGLPDAASPAALGLSEDNRLLGVRLRRLEYQPS